MQSGPREAFTLASLAALGTFPQVHLARRLAPGALSAALGSYLRLQDDELLLALIDGHGGKLEGRCALTTERIYWVSGDHAEEPRPSNAPRPSKREKARALRCFVMPYHALAASVTARRQPDGASRLDLGGGNVLIRKDTDGQLAQSLAGSLEMIGNAARAGVVSSLSERDPDLAARVARVMPAVELLTTQARKMGQELHEFRQALDAATPRVYMTPAFTGVCVAVFILMACAGVPLVSPTATQLVRRGANEGTRVISGHEYWRLITSVFVHGGLIHLALNMWSLMAIGPLVERLYGNFTYAVIYLAAGVGGAIASVAASPIRVSVGASGAICGVLGALLAFLVAHRRSVPTMVLKPLRATRSAMSYSSRSWACWFPISTRKRTWAGSRSDSWRACSSRAPGQSFGANGSWRVVCWSRRASSPRWLGGPSRCRRRV